MNRASTRRIFVCLSIMLICMTILTAPIKTEAFSVKDLVTKAAAAYVCSSSPLCQMKLFVGSILDLVVAPLVGISLVVLGKIFDAAIEFSFAIARLLESVPVQTAWTLVRDIVNLFFIFLLIRISILTIIKGGSFDTKDKLGKVILAAILINFSLYITKAVVDISNILVIWLYDAIVALSPGGKSLGEILVGSTGLLTLALPGKGSAVGTNLLEFESILYPLFKILLSLGFIYILFRACFMFIGRGIAFVFLAISSPIGFLGDVFDELKGKQDEWRKHLKGTALEAPIFLLMVYIVLRIVGGVKAAVATGPLASPIFSNAPFTFGMLFVYAFLMYLLSQALSVSKEYSSKLSNGIETGIRSAVKTVLGTAAVAGVGRIANANLQGSLGNKMRDMAASDSVFARIAGMGGLKTLGAATKYDFGVKGGRKEFEKTTGFGAPLGKDSEGGYKGVVDSITKKRTENAKLLGSDLKGLARREAVANIEKGSFWNSIFMNSSDKDAIKKKILEDAAKDGGKTITEVVSRAEADIKANPVVGTFSEQTQLDTIERELKDQQTRLAMDEKNGIVSDAGDKIKDLETRRGILAAKKADFDKNTAKTTADISALEKSLENGSVDQSKALGKNLENLFKTVEEKFTEKIITPISKNLETVSNDLEKASGDRKESLKIQKEKEEKAFEERQKDLKDARMILANLPEDSAEAVLKAADTNPAIMVSLGARVRKSRVQKLNELKKGSDAKNKKKLEEAQIAFMEKATGNEPPKETPPETTKK